MFSTYTAKYTKIKSGYMGQLVEWPEVVTVYSGRKRTVIPVQSGHLFRFKAATDSG